MQEQEPWLELDKGPEKVDPTLADAGIAQLHYDIFVNNPNGARLLKYWEETFTNFSTPVNAPIQTYVALESKREFIRIIKGQILLAQQQRKSK